ncbi:MAG: hypothetical protein IKW96_01810 [Ruminococcus sp.]|uniref:hypothetical protein n=1 Tax=Ruminococcus sp. TaxID=41978 RepID=UPI0025F360A2|nr:hypothetical protein [Ruminococcus sp.]MBR5682004.1 hypothetical protein [Ruminococcus sp.]
MSTGEILVIAAAAAVFIIINVIMWSIIIAKERKNAPRPEKTVAAAAPEDKNIELPDSVPASAAEMGFRLLENTVIVHTDDRI